MSHFRWSAFIYRIVTPVKVHLADFTLGKSQIVIPFMVRWKQRKLTVQCRNSGFNPVYFTGVGITRDKEDKNRLRLAVS